MGPTTTRIYTLSLHDALPISYELATGEIHVFRAKSVIFASGGFGKIFKTTSNAHTLTGDGPAMTLRRGIPLEDMEFFQFHPTGLAGLRSEEHTSELQSRGHLVCRLLL